MTKGTLKAKKLHCHHWECRLAERAAVAERKKSFFKNIKQYWFYNYLLVIPTLLHIWNFHSGDKKGKPLKQYREIKVPKWEIKVYVYHTCKLVLCQKGKKLGCIFTQTDFIGFSNTHVRQQNTKIVWVPGLKWFLPGMSIGSSSVNCWDPWIVMALIRNEESFQGPEKTHPCHRLGRNQVDHMTNRAGGTWLSGFMSGHMARFAQWLNTVDSSFKSVFLFEIVHPVLGVLSNVSV